MDERLNELRAIWRDYRDFYTILGGAALVLLGIALGAALFGQDGGYPTNLYTEFLSISAAVLVLDVRAQRREEKRQQRELKERLVREAASYSNEMAKRSLYELHYRGWLYGDNSLLMGANLLGANLEGANLETANLERANLSTANLVESRLFDAHLKKADLYRTRLDRALLSYTDLTQADMDDASLRAANLAHANLQQAHLTFANLRDASLLGANLCGANLKGATLEGALLAEVRCDENTVLPDGSRWHPGVDWGRFGGSLSASGAAR